MEENTEFSLYNTATVYDITVTMMVGCVGDTVEAEEE